MTETELNFYHALDESFATESSGSEDDYEPSAAERRQLKEMGLENEKRTRGKGESKGNDDGNENERGRGETSENTGNRGAERTSSMPPSVELVAGQQGRESVCSMAQPSCCGFGEQGSSTKSN